MKNIFLFVIATYALAFGRSQAQILTNDTIIGEGMRFSVSATTVDKSSYLILKNTTSNRFNFILIPGSVPWCLSSYLCLVVKTTNGIPIPRTDKGEDYIKKPEKPFRLKEEAEGSRTLPPLIDLFQISSNGEYILEARVWWWNRTDKKLVLSDPVRVKVIARNIAPTNSISQVQTNALSK